MEYPTTYPEECDDPRFNSNFTSLVWYAYTWMYSTTEVQLFTIWLPIALIVSIIANGAFLYVVVKIPRLHTITNYYLANLAFADVGFVVISVSSYLHSYVDSPVRLDVPYNSFVGCAGVFGIPYVMYYASLGLVSLVTLERYYGICYPLQHLAIASKSRTKKLIAITWIVACVFSVLRTLNWSQHTQYCIIWPQIPDFIGWPQKLEFCLPINTNISMFSNIFDVITFFTAFIWNGYMYARIIYSVRNRELTAKNSDEETDAQRKLKLAASKISAQVTRLLIINGSLLFICQIWIRINSLDIVFKELAGISLYRTEATAGIMLLFGRCMLYVNSSLNPFVYNLTSSFYRAAFKEAFCGRIVKPKRSGSSTASTSTCTTRL